jgi:hypothetical protein
MINYIKIITVLIIGSVSTYSLSQEGEQVEVVSNAIREISPSYRITENPQIIDTVVKIPQFTYPLLTRNMKTSIQTEEIEASKIKIVDKLDKIYPGYVKVGLGTNSMPLGEVYYNSTRNRKISYGIHAKHLSAFGKVKDYAPAQFDHTKAKVFSNFFLSKHLIESEVNWLNHGYHYYGIKNDSIPKDSLKNRVGAYQGKVSFSNLLRKDSARLAYKINADYGFFHEFLKDSATLSTNARESNFGLGTNLSYKHELNVFALDLDFRFNKYQFGELDTTLLAYRKKELNHILHLRPTISSYRFDDKLKIELGLDLNFDFSANTIFKPLFVANLKYSLLDGMFIPYLGIDGNLTQNTFHNLNRSNPYINSTVDLKNTKELKIYGGIKGTLSKNISFDIHVKQTNFTDMALFINDTIFSDQYKFNVLYDDISKFSFGGSITYQDIEKLKIDAIVDYNIYSTTDQEYAWYLPELEITLRGSYNIFDKIYAKADFTLKGGRKSPNGILNPDPTDAKQFDADLIADANLHLEYRYNKRISAFLQFNNIANQRYHRWMNYPVYGFQVLGGVTFGF